MAQSPKDEKRAEDRRQLRLTSAGFYQARQQASGVTNPTFGQNPFDPNDYIPQADTSAAEPLPTGQYIDPNFASPLNVERMTQTQEFLENPEKYVDDNKLNIINEQSLLDQGKSMLSRIFDYEDEPDASLFGVDLSAVESTWDSVLRYTTGFYDVINVGLGGLISAMPGGVQTLSGEELSGGKSFLEVLSGEMKPGDAPSPGQIAITSIGIEAARIRRGETRVSDVLLANPATGPFILAALAADTSPVQKKDFDILDPEQRTKAFGQGYEQWMSGITDAGLMFADPLIGVGVGAKVIRTGALGARLTPKDRARFSTALYEAVDLIDQTHMGGRSSAREAQTLVEGASQREAKTLRQTTRDLETDTPREQPLNEFLPTLPKGVKAGDYNGNELARLLHRFTEFDSDGKKVMNVDEISRDLGVKNHNRRADVATLLYNARTPYEAALILDMLSGNRAAQQTLTRLAPAAADHAYRVTREALTGKIGIDAQSAKVVTGFLDRSLQNITERLKTVADDIVEVQGRTPTDEAGRQSASETLTRLQEQQRILQQSADELDELKQVTNPRVDAADNLDPASPFYDQAEARRIVDDLVNRESFYERAADPLLEGSAVNNRFWYPSKNNVYSRMVMRSRERRGRAAYQYSVEGAGILPRTIYRGVDKATGKPIYDKQGWFSDSIFEGTGRLQRGLRAWRWLGTETPNGYIGLKGTATVGSERELDAVFSGLDLYKGDAINVTVDGQVFSVGGRERAVELKGRVLNAMNDPNQDAFKVLRDVEDLMVEDYYKAYFGAFDTVDPKNLQGKTPARKAIDNVVLRARQVKQSYERTIREEGYWVDEAGDINEAAFLDSQLANGTYMLPFQELEKIFKKDIKKRGDLRRLHQTLSTSGEYISRFDQTFQSFWRPMTLLRLSYIQRNTFEGVLRAAAYQASLAPFTWPITGTALGVRNAVMKRVAKRNVKIAEKRLTDQSGIKQSVFALDEARADRHFLENAFREIDPDTGGNVFVVFDKNRQRRTLNEAEYEEELFNTRQRIETEEARLGQVSEDFTAQVKGTAFGRWRAKQIKAVEERIAENQKAMAAYTDMGEDALGEDWLRTLPDDELDDVAELLRADLFEQQQLTMLQYQPARALAAYRTQAGRQKRIGSGTSMGPDGSFYGDAFYGPYAQINRALMSADKTTQQRLQARFDAYTSILENTRRRTNQPIPWGSGSNLEAWSAGVATTIEEAASSWVTRRLLLNDGDVVKTLAEIETLAEGKTWLRRISNLFAEDVDLTDVPIEAQMITMPDSNRLIPFAETAFDPLSKKPVTVIDRERASIYLDEVKRRLDITMQRNATGANGEKSDALYDLLMARVREKDVPAGRVTAQGDVMQEVEISAESVRSALATIPDDIKNNFGAVAGTELIYLGTDSFMGSYSKLVNKLFNAFGTVPEDALVRGPFYNQRFKETRNALMRQYMEQSGQSDALVPGMARGSSEQIQMGTLRHSEVKIPQKELSRIMVQSHRQALQDTREWLYTIERRTNLGKYGEYLFPFISASQNSITVIGKLLYKEPWLAPFIADLWRMPQRLGIEDEEGNIKMPMPFAWVQDYLAKNPQIPVVGGVVANSDIIRIPKDGINVFLPDTGFGVAPRPGPIVQVGASELMKANFISQETPEALKSAMGEENAADFWRLLQDWVFGEEQGMSPEFASYDRLIPAAYQKLLRSKQELSSQYGYKYMLAGMTEHTRYWAGERDEPPTEAEINQRATNALLFDMIGNIGVPTPMTPYPILTRPQVNSAVEVLQDEYRVMMARDPINASMMFSKLFGDWALLQANSKITRNVGGADPSSATVSDIRTLDPLIRQVTAQIPDTNLEVLGILVNNRNAAGEYEQSPYAWQKANKIPGTNREWREIQAPQASEEERQRIAGWTMYRQFMDQLEAKMENAGVESLETNAGRPYKESRRQFLRNMAANPDYAGWWTDFKDMGGSNTLSAVKTLEAGVNDPTFRELLVKDGKTQLLSNMEEYVTQRRNLVELLRQTGKSIEHEDNLLYKLAWAKMRQDWKSKDPRWAEIANRYLANDDNPESPGLVQQQLEATQGANNG